MNPYAFEVWISEPPGAFRVKNFLLQFCGSEISYKEEGPIVYKRGYFGNDDEMLGRLMMSFSNDKVYNLVEIIFPR